MLPPKEAVDAAKAHLRQHFPETETKHFRVEEIQKQGSEWHITFGWVDPAYAEVGGNLLAPLPPSIQRLPRVYKKVRIQAEDGEFIAIDHYSLPDSD